MNDAKPVIQIYEVQQPDEAEQMVALGVDHVGSVVLDPERWKVASLKDTVRVVGQAGAKSSMIPLFSDADIISRMLDFYQPAMVHFCEHLPLDKKDRKALSGVFAVQRQVKQRFPEIAVMRTLPVGLPGKADPDGLLALLPEIEPLCDWFLTDTIPALEDAAPVPGFVGITGKPADWSAVAKLVASTRVPVILAGGMSPENVYEGLVQTRPAGVDSCTQTNLRDGAGNPVRFKKDVDRVRRFIEEIRRAGCRIDRGDATTGGGHKTRAF